MAKAVIQEEPGLISSAPQLPPFTLEREQPNCCLPHLYLGPVPCCTTRGMVSVRRMQQQVKGKAGDDRKRCPAQIDADIGFEPGQQLAQPRDLQFLCAVRPLA